MSMIIKAICTLSVIPMRAEPNDRSEMVSQMLFGETCDIIAENEKWYSVITHFDKYTGWVDKKQLKVSIASNNTTNKITIKSPDILVHTDTGEIQLFEGSEISVLNNNFYLGNTPIRLNKHNMPYMPLKTIEMLDVAVSFCNSPYLWGGRTRAGIDCSGFTQLMYKLMGTTLPRDASMQVNEGFAIEYDSIRPGDLAFFHNTQARVVHVGILLEANRIIHASGSVKIDILTPEGIFNVESKSLSHHFNSIKRLVP